MRQCEHGCNGCDNCTDYEGTHPMTTLEDARDVPEALRLADWIDSDFNPDDMHEFGYDQIATELRRLQDENERQRCSIEALAARRNAMSDRIAQLEAERRSLIHKMVEQSKTLGIMIAEKELSLQAQLAQRQVPADGWVMVPKEPTLLMQTNALSHVTRQHQTRDIYRAMLAASPTPPQRDATADDMREPKNGKDWRVEWWNESLRMMLPSNMQLDGVRHFSSGTMTLTLKQRKAAHGIKGEEDAN